MRIVFFHIGPDTHTSLFVRSIRKFIPEAEMIQCTNGGTLKIDGVDDVVRVEGNETNLMRFRTECFSKIQADSPTLFLDTDMLVVQNFKLEQLMADYHIVACKRFFNAETLVNTQFRNQDLTRYEGQTLGDAWPFLGCFNAINEGVGFWRDCLAYIEANYDESDDFWYTDQEAIKHVLRGSNEPYGVMPEHIVACLPDLYQPELPRPLILHFKGSQRKRLMRQIAGELNLH